VRWFAKSAGIGSTVVFSAFKKRKWSYCN